MNEYRLGQIHDVEEVVTGQATYYCSEPTCNFQGVSTGTAIVKIPYNGPKPLFADNSNFYRLGQATAYHNAIKAIDIRAVVRQHWEQTNHQCQGKILIK